MSSNEAYLDDLLKAMSEGEENGTSAMEDELTDQLIKSEPEPEVLPEESGVEPELEELRPEPETESEVEELRPEPETESEIEELFPELEAGTEELFVEPENELEPEELFTEPEIESEAEELLSEQEPLLAEPVMLSDAEELRPEPVQEELTEEDDAQNTKPSTDEVKHMTEEEIQELLQLSAMEEDPEEADSTVAKEQEIADDDLDKLLKDMESGDDNLAEINALLYKAENNQPVNPEGEESAVSSEQETESLKKGKEKKEKASKSKKGKKGLFGRKKKGLDGEEAGAVEDQQPLEDLFTFGTDGELDGAEPGSLDGDKKESNQKEQAKKSGFFSRIMNFLLEDDEDSEEEGVKDEADQLKTTTDENQEVLKQLKKEDQEGKKKKKKKGKGKDAAGEEDENDDEGIEETGKEKKKKVKKEKKEKPPKPVDDTPQPKLSKKKVRSTALFAFTILAAILVCCLFVPELSQLSDARNAFYDGDYETCYRTLYGKRLSESDRRMFEQSQMMLAIDRNLEAYENYVAVGDELHALDTLLQAVQKQEKLLIEAEKYGLAAEAEAAYQRVLTTLVEKYQLTEADAIEINSYEQDAVYTLRVKSIVEGTEFLLPAYLQQGADVNMEPQESVPEESVEDVLSAEEELPDTEYEEGILEP